LRVRVAPRTIAKRASDGAAGGRMRGRAVCRRVSHGLLRPAGQLVFLQSIREGYELEEDMAGFCARHAGSMNEAALHHANVLAARDP